MDDAVIAYKKRRQARLDAKAVFDYRERRDQRWIARMDAEEEEGNNRNKGSGGAGGNMRIPFGLCQREGIKIEPNWTPRDAWDALAGKGYSAGEVYKELKATGKVAKKSAASKPKKAPTKLDDSHFAADLIKGAYKKNTLAFAKYLNDKCSDGEITELLSLATATGAKNYPTISLKRSMDGEGCYIRPRWYTTTGKPHSMDMVIPQISKGTTEEQRAEAVRSFAHEYTHYLDYLARDEETKHDAFTATNKDLMNAINANDGLAYGEEAGRLFKKFNEGHKAIREKYAEEKEGIPNKIAKEMFGDTRPEWLYDDGRISYWKARYEDLKDLKKYERAVNAAKKDCDERRNREKRAYLNGLSNFQGLYDALSGGRLRERGDVMYGHSRSYYTKEPTNKAMELIADYVALRVDRPDLIEVFRNDKPDIAAELDRSIEEMIKRLRG